LSVSVRTIGDLEYSRIEDADLFLDIHRPATDEPVPCVVYFHGGGWARGSRKERVEERLLRVAAQGLAVASVSYRFTDIATYPAQLEDGRAALSWLRANASEYGLQRDGFGAWGASAGGWIALMLALTGEDPSQRADTACAWFTPANLASVTSEREAAGLPMPDFMEGRPMARVELGLLGLDALEDDPELARDASPLSHVGDARGPILLIHGDRDGMINLAQSVAMHDALQAAGADSQLLVLPGANHEDPAFNKPAVLAATAGFLLASLSPQRSL
jgi:acetyl esterase/lipase